GRGGEQRAAVVLQRGDVDQPGEGADPAEDVGAVRRRDGLLHQLDGTVARSGVDTGGGVGDRIARGGAGGGVHASFPTAAGSPGRAWRMPCARATGSARATGYFPEKQAVHSRSSGWPVAAIIPSSEMKPRESAPSERAISAMPRPLAMSSAREAKSMP